MMSRHTREMYPYLTSHTAGKPNVTPYQSPEVVHLAVTAQGRQAASAARGIIHPSIYVTHRPWRDVTHRQPLEAVHLIVPQHATVQ